MKFGTDQTAQQEFVGNSAYLNTLKSKILMVCVYAVYDGTKDS
jgi:hypothetical protein